MLLRDTSKFQVREEALLTARELTRLAEEVTECWLELLQRI